MQLECMRFTPDSAMGPSVELSKPRRRSAERLGALRAMIDNSNPGEPDANLWDEAVTSSPPSAARYCGPFPHARSNQRCRW